MNMDIKAEEKNMMEQAEQEAMKKIPPEIMEMISGGADDGSEDKPVGPPYVCKICGASFRSITAIACHMSGVHK